jgi:hypothetical protein
MLIIIIIVLYSVFVYLHAELDRQGPITESARIQNNNNTNTRTKQINKQIKKAKCTELI